MDYQAPGSNEEVDVCGGRRYFSRSELEIDWLLGFGWIPWFYERLVNPAGVGGVAEIRHVDWYNPYAGTRSALHYDGTGYVAPSTYGKRVDTASSSDWPGAAWVLTYKDGRKHYFDALGRIIARVGSSGIDAIEFTYDEQGRVDEIIDSRGQVFQLGYANGYLRTVTDPEGETVEYVVEGGLLREVIYPERWVLANTFDGSGDPVTSSWGAATFRTTSIHYDYNPNGKLEAVRNDAGEIVESFTYDPFVPSQIETITQADGGLWEFEHAGNVRIVTDPRGFERRYELDANGSVISIDQYIASVNPGTPSRATSGSHRWEFVRDPACSCGRLKEVISPEGRRTEYVYDSNNDLKEVRLHSNDASGTLLASYGFDAQHRLSSFTPPHANASGSPADWAYTYEYEILPPAHATNPGGLVVTATNPAGTTQADYAEWVWTYDRHRRLVSVEGPDHDSGTPGLWATWEYYPASDPVNAHLAKRHITRRDGSLWTEYTYDRLGRVLSAVDQAGNETDAVYDAQGNLIEWVSPDVGAQRYRREWRYDGDGNLSKTRYSYTAFPPAPGGPPVRWLWIYRDFWYDGGGRLLHAATDLDGGVRAEESFEYDLNGNLIGYVDPDGVVQTHLYDERNLLWKTWAAPGTSEETYHSFDYTPDGSLAEIDAPSPVSGRISTFLEYDGFGRLEARELDGEQRVEFDLDAAARMLEVRSFARSAGGSLQMFSRERALYDDWHEGATWAAQDVYDQYGSTLLRTIETEVDYGPSGKPLTLTVAGEVMSRFSYREDGAPTAVWDDDGNRDDFYYDATSGFRDEHRQTLMDPVSGQPLVTGRVFENDAIGRVLEVRHFGQGEADVAVSYAYDPLGNVIRRTDGGGVQTHWSYRYDSRLKLVQRDVDSTGVAASTETYSYSPAGRMLSATGDTGRTVTWDYDVLGRAWKEIYADQSFREYDYGPAGQPTWIKLPAGRTIEYDYTARGLPEKREVRSAGGSLQREDFYEWTYSGHLRRVIRSEGGQAKYVEFTRDSEGRPLTEDQDGHVVTYARDGIGRLTNLQGPNSSRIFEYDSHHRVKRVSDGLTGAVAGFTYLGPGQSLRRRTMRDGSQLDVLRDGFGRLEQLSTVRSGVTLFDLGYAWSSNSLLQYEDRLHDGLGDVYRYDGLRRLREVVRDSDDVDAELLNPGSTTHDFTRTFHLDGDAHRTQVDTLPDGGSLQSVTYTTHPNRHHYIDIGGTTRQSDADGNLVADGNRTYHYDASDNLVEVRDSGVTTATYHYDALDRRISKTVGSVSLRFVHAGPWLIEEYRREGGGPEALEAVHHYGTGVDELVMSRRIDRADLDQDGNTVEAIDVYLHRNQIGSVIGLSIQTGAVVETYHYDSFGAPTIRDLAGTVVASAPSGNRFMFTGREFDGETGLYHYRARTYDPAAGTFLQEDPLGFVDSLNPVLYALANPCSLSDPMGTESLEEAVNGIIDFIYENRHTLVDVLLDAIGPLGSAVDLISAVSGLDFRAWMSNGFQGDAPELGWGSRITLGGVAAAGLATGGVVGLVKLFKLLKAKRTAKACSVAKEGVGAAKGAPDRLFHYTTTDAAGAIAEEGLMPGQSGRIYLTPEGGYSPMQAHLDLALPPNRAANALFEVDTGAMQRLGMEVPGPTAVGRSYNMPGGGLEVAVDRAVPPELLRRIR